MKGLLAVLALVMLLLFGCASNQQRGNNGGNNQIQGGGAIRDKVILIGPNEPLQAKVGKYFEYSYCVPKPVGTNAMCGGLVQTTNPRGGKGPYTFFLGTMGGFQPFGLTLHLNGLLSGIPSAAGKRTFEVCAKDIGGDYGCENTTVIISEDTGAVGVWELITHSLMNGPEGSFPAGCSMDQKMQLNLTQNGNVVGGIAIGTMAKTSNCGIWSVDLTSPQTAAVTGSFSAPSITFTVGTIDFTGTVAGNSITGTMKTCRSPDPRCTGNGLQQLNWYSGDFTATRTG